MTNRRSSLGGWAVAVLLSCIVSGSASERENDSQWLYRVPDGEPKQPLAIFLSSNYSSVLFRAWCEDKNELVIAYYGDGVTPLKDGKLAIGSDDFSYKFIPLNTALTASNVLEGRIAVTPQFARKIAAAESIAIDAPNEMDEEWHTGEALPLKRIVRDCH